MLSRAPPLAVVAADLVAAVGCASGAERHAPIYIATRAAKLGD